MKVISLSWVIIVKETFMSFSKREKEHIMSLIISPFLSMVNHIFQNSLYGLLQLLLINKTLIVNTKCK